MSSLSHLALRRIAGLSVAVTVAAHGVVAQPVGNCSPALGEAYLDVGNVRARVLNNGVLIYRKSGDPDFVYNIPLGAPTHAIFSSSLWIGGLLDGSPQVSGTRYGPSAEFWPGPLDEAGNPPFDCAPFDRLYKVSRADVAAFESTGHATPDLAEWPTGLGAPTLDVTGNEIDLSAQELRIRQDRTIDLAAGERPAFVGDQMIWWVMNDMGNVHLSIGGDPIGLEVQGLAFAFDEPGILGNTTFYRYTISKKGIQPLTDAYFGIFADPDLGWPGDDWIGSDSTLGLGFAWNADNEDTWRGEGYGTPPPAVGFDFFQGAIVPSPGDVATLRGRPVADHRNLAMTSVYYWSTGTIDPSPHTPLEYYRNLQGLWKDGTPMSVTEFWRGPGGPTTTWLWSGDAARCQFWSECNSTAAGTSQYPGDRNFVLGSGPFEIAAASSQEVLWGVVYGRGSDNFDSVTALKEADAEIQSFVDSGFTDRPRKPLPPEGIPDLLVPAESAPNQPPHSTFLWTCPIGAFYCQVEIASDSSFAQIVGSGIGTELTVDLGPNRTYWWRARAVGRHEMPGPWSRPSRVHIGSTVYPPTIRDFQVVSNAAGPLEPADCGAYAFNSSGFPLTTCGSDRPHVGRQQATANTVWGIHAGGASNLSFGPESDPGTYLGRGWGSRHETGSSSVLLPYDYEWRFTAEGGKAWRGLDDGAFMDVPFELWRSPPGTTDDRNDDVRLVPLVCERACNAGLVDYRFDIGRDHLISGGSNDPSSDEVFFYLPDDESPSQAGYEAFLAGTGSVREIAAHQVLVCWNCGSEPPYPQEYPEVGTVFRMVTGAPPAPILAAPGDGDVIPGDSARFYWNGPQGMSFALEFWTDVLNPSPEVTYNQVRSGDLVAIPGPGVWYWRVTTDSFGRSDAWQIQFVPSALSADPEDLPTDFALEPAWPNPFNPVATIRYALPVASSVRLEVFDVLGRRVATLVNDPAVMGGFHETRFDASRLASGVYLVALRAGPVVRTRTVVLAK